MKNLKSLIVLALTSQLFFGCISTYPPAYREPEKEKVIVIYEPYPVPVHEHEQEIPVVTSRPIYNPPVTKERTNVEKPVVEKVREDRNEKQASKNDNQETRNSGERTRDTGNGRGR